MEDEKVKTLIESDKSRKIFNDIQEKKVDLVISLVEDLFLKLGLEGDDRYEIYFNVKIKKILNEHTNSYFPNIISIVYDPNLKQKTKIPLYNKRGGPYYFPLEECSLKDILELISILDKYFDFEEFKKRYFIYKKIKISNILEEVELKMVEYSLREF